jgi:hypothetical protein
VLRKICGPKGKKHDTGERGAHIPYTSPNIIRTINSYRIGWAGHVARKKKNIQRVSIGKMYQGAHLQDLGVSDLILKYIQKKHMEGTYEQD